MIFKIGNCLTQSGTKDLLWHLFCLGEASYFKNAKIWDNVPNGKIGVQNQTIKISQKLAYLNLNLLTGYQYQCYIYISLFIYNK